MTQYERIMSMELSELAEFFVQHDDADSCCRNCGIKAFCEWYVNRNGAVDCVEAYEAWLKSEVDE